MVDNHVSDSHSGNGAPGEPSPAQLSPEEEKRRQIFLLIGLAILFGVIVVYQVYRLRDVRKEPTQGPLVPKVFPLRVGPNEMVAVHKGRLVAKGTPLIIFEEYYHPEKLHLTWVNAWAPPEEALVCVDFAVSGDIAKATPNVNVLSSLNGLVEWEVGSVKKRGIPDAMGGFYDVSEADVDPKVFFMILDPVPPLCRPSFVSPQEVLEEQVIGRRSADGIVSATFVPALEDTDRVLGVSCAGVSKAFPIKILNYHSLVNDTFGNQPVVITYSPFAGAGTAYRHSVSDATNPFWLTNLVHNGGEVISDLKTRSLWTAFDGRCVTGPRHGETLESTAAIQTTWKEWREKHPDTLVLSSKTGFEVSEASPRGIPYGIDQLRGPREGQDYYQLEETIIPIVLPDGKVGRTNVPLDARIRNKAWVVGVRTPKPIAFDIEKLAEAGSSPREVTTGDKTIRVYFDAKDLTGYATDAAGDSPLPDATLCLWYAWRTLYPGTELYQ